MQSSTYWKRCIIYYLRQATNQIKKEKEKKTEILRIYLIQRVLKGEAQKLISTPKVCTGLLIVFLPGSQLKVEVNNILYNVRSQELTDIPGR